MTSRTRAPLQSITCRSRNAVGVLLLFAVAGLVTAQDAPVSCAQAWR